MPRTSCHLPPKPGSWQREGVWQLRAVDSRGGWMVEEQQRVRWQWCPLQLVRLGLTELGVGSGLWSSGHILLSVLQSERSLSAGVSSTSMKPFIAPQKCGFCSGNFSFAR